MVADEVGYSNVENPFGDSNLAEIFVWMKKRERDVARGVDPDELTAEARERKRTDLFAEVAKVKRRREEREHERRLYEEEKQRLAREREHEQNRDWEKKEDEFHIEQACCVWYQIISRSPSFVLASATHKTASVQLIN